MSAWHELRSTGVVGAEFVTLLYGTVDAVRRFDRYPPPEDADRWTPGAVQEFAHDFLVSPGGTERLGRLAATADNEESFERLLEAAVRNEFRMKARRTDKGAALRAITHAVEQSGQITVMGSTPTTRTWSLPAFTGNAPYAGSLATLVDAAHSVTNVRLARWSLASRRRPPIAEPDSLRRVMHTVLDTAAAPVSPTLMLDVILARFPLIVGGTVEFDDDRTADSTADLSASLIAAEIFEQLTDNERLVAGLVDLPVREIADLAGLSRSTAQRAAASAREVLARALRDSNEQHAVIAAIASASARLRARGTKRADSASADAEED